MDVAFNMCHNCSLQRLKGNTISGEQDGAGVLDELAVDETKAYKQKISKYIRSSLSCVKEALFFLR